MPANAAIRIENVSKKFEIRHQAEVGGLRHDLQNLALLPGRILQKQFKRLQGASGNTPDQSQGKRREVFWALKDLSFEIKQGEVIGLIGHNGAGKSTLLKIVSRITEPTAGRIGIKGRVASLLEIGTGFHPDLTGRENILLNGAILGMSRREIVSQFDQIVDFAGVEKFIDTPVKRYSTGMYVRLAFAVAAHINTEILVIDEILAVGDAEFQKKCLGKMREVATDSGRTILFVSHQLTSVVALCSRAILLQNGSVEADSDAKSVVELYQKRSLSLEDSDDLPPNENRPGRGTMRISMVKPEKRVFDPAGDKRFTVRVITHDPEEAPCYLSLIFRDENNHILFILDSRHVGTPIIPGGDSEFSVVLHTPWMRPGEYSVSAELLNFDVIDNWEQACRFGVSNELPYSGVIRGPAISSSLVLPEFSVAVSSSTPQ
ncbi:MAG TPA: polysaccharide ABC transporter ATP-binding protein [Chthoniobacterales bacterium]